MPGTTMASNTRASRSRYSSPQINHTTPNGGSGKSSKGPTPSSASASASASATQNQKDFMARWLEPPVQVKPSYQDAGLVRHGVVEGMAPLGTLPKAGIFKKAAPAAQPETTPTPTPTPTPPTRRIILKRPTNTNTANSTPKAAPAPVAPPVPASSETEEIEDSTEDDEREDEEDVRRSRRLSSSRRRSATTIEADDNYAPSKPVQRGTSKSVNTRRSLSRASATRRNSSMALSSPSLQHTAASSVSGRASESLKDVADKVIEVAVDEALTHFRYPTAWALRALYDENSENVKFLSMVQDVFMQTADPETVEEFARLVQDKKKVGKKGNKGWLYFVPPATSNPSTPHRPKPAPYSNLVRLEVPKPGADREQSSAQFSARTSSARTSSAQASARASVQPSVERDQQLQSQQDAQKKKRKQEVDDALDHIDETPSKKRQRKSSVSKHRESATPSKSVMASGGRKANSAAKSNGKAKLTESPSMRRKTRRSDSISSLSSTLSSARSMTPPDGIEDGNAAQDTGDEEDEEDAFDVPPSRTSPAAGKRNNAPAPTAPQPIARPRRSNNAAAKKKQNVSPTTSAPASSATIPTAAAGATNSSNNNHHQNSSARHKGSSSAAAAGAASSMPALVEPPLFPNLQLPKKGAYKGARGEFQDKDKPIFASKVGRLDPNDPKVLLNRKAKNVTNGHVPTPESSVREEERANAGRLHVALEKEAARSKARSSRASIAGSTVTEGGNGAGNGGNLNAGARSTRSSLKRPHDEMDDQVSPTSFQFPQLPIPDEPSTARTSRAATPALRPPAKKQRTGLRVKNSPMKKKSGTSAGIPRASGERSSPVPNGLLPREDDNDDYCSSCGGNGELLCCDGCTRAFHLSCVDPPLIEDRMPADWFCNVCLCHRGPGHYSHAGAFSTLLDKLEAKNASAYRLPLSIREYFEGVRTGVDGEYEEVVVVQKPSRKKKVEEEVPDFFRLRDNEGNSVICHHCQRATADNRAIIPCSVCGLWWHIDCLDPPTAHPPVLRTWRCPAHVDEILAKVPGALGPAHKYRKIKNAQVITPTFSRGNVNNGYIEVIPEESEDESGWKDVNTYGKIYRLPEKGIKLDFFSRMRENRKGKRIAPLSAASSQLIGPQTLSPRDLERQQAALNLVQLSGQGSASVGLLVDTLLNEADPAVISLMARANPNHVNHADTVSKLTHMDTQSIRAMLVQMEAMTARLQDALARDSRVVDDSEKPTSPVSDGQLSPRSQAPIKAAVELGSKKPVLRLPLGEAAESDDASSKELPSPPATDQLDEKTSGEINVAISSDPLVGDEIKAEVDEEGMDLD